MRTVAISGSRGLIGSALKRALESSGHAVRPLGRGDAAAEGLAGVDAVVNLAGENIAQRWTAAARARIRSSRVETTSAIARALATMGNPPRVFISGSAIGVYGDRGEERLDESSTPGRDFLAEVCAAWEAAAAPASAVARVAYLRTGMVLSPRGGALPKLLPAFRLGIGGRIGSGQQWVSWISLPDMVRAIEYLLADDRASGPFNIVAPAPVTNDQFSRMLGSVLHRPTALAVPRFALKLALGEMAKSTVLASQRVEPRRLSELGFEWRHATLESALRAVID
jgi:hypothetical protein